mgnify:CR=1 FL=1
MTPKDRKYTKSHEWIKVDGNLVIVGITEHAQSELGDITYVELPGPGTAVEQGGDCAEIESVKAASDIYSPVSGTVAEVNDALEDAPEIVNESPYDKGWIFKLKDVDVSQLAALMDAAAYEASLED